MRMRTRRVMMMTRRKMIDEDDDNSNDDDGDDDTSRLLPVDASHLRSITRILQCFAICIGIKE